MASTVINTDHIGKPPPEKELMLEEGTLKQKECKTKDIAINQSTNFQNWFSKRAEHIGGRGQLGLKDKIKTIVQIFRQHVTDPSVQKLLRMWQGSQVSQARGYMVSSLLDFQIVKWSRNWLAKISGTNSRKRFPGMSNALTTISRVFSWNTKKALEENTSVAQINHAEEGKWIGMKFDYTQLQNEKLANDTPQMSLENEDQHSKCVKTGAYPKDTHVLVTDDNLPTEITASSGISNEKLELEYIDPNSGSGFELEIDAPLVHEKASNPKSEANKLTQVNTKIASNVTDICWKDVNISQGGAEIHDTNNVDILKDDIILQDLAPAPSSQTIEGKDINSEQSQIKEILNDEQKIPQYALPDELLTGKVIGNHSIEHTVNTNNAKKYSESRIISAETEIIDTEYNESRRKTEIVENSEMINLNKENVPISDHKDVLSDMTFTKITIPSHIMGEGEGEEHMTNSFQETKPPSLIEEPKAQEKDVLLLQDFKKNNEIPSKIELGNDDSQTHMSDLVVLLTDKETSEHKQERIEAVSGFSDTNNTCKSIDITSAEPVVFEPNWIESQIDCNIKVNKQDPNLRIISDQTITRDIEPVVELDAMKASSDQCLGKDMSSKIPELNNNSSLSNEKGILTEPSVVSNHITLGNNADIEKSKCNQIKSYEDIEKDNTEECKQEIIEDTTNENTDINQGDVSHGDDECQLESYETSNIVVNDTDANKPVVMSTSNELSIPDNPENDHINSPIRIESAEICIKSFIPSSETLIDLNASYATIRQDIANENENPCNVEVEIPVVRSNTKTFETNIDESTYQVTSEAYQDLGSPNLASTAELESQNPIFPVKRGSSDFAIDGKHPISTPRRSSRRHAQEEKDVQKGELPDQNLISPNKRKRNSSIEQEKEVHPKEKRQNMGQEGISDELFGSKTNSQTGLPFKTVFEESERSDTESTVSEFQNDLSTNSNDSFVQSIELRIPLGNINTSISLESSQSSGSSPIPTNTPTCEVCSQQFQGKGANQKKNIHMVSHFKDELYRDLKESSPPFSCPVEHCKYTCKDKSSWARHYGQVHKKVSEYVAKVVSTREMNKNSGIEEQKPSESQHTQNRSEKMSADLDSSIDSENTVKSNSESSKIDVTAKEIVNEQAEGPLSINVNQNQTLTQKDEINRSSNPEVESERTSFEAKDPFTNNLSVSMDDIDTTSIAKSLDTPKNIQLSENTDDILVDANPTITSPIPITTNRGPRSRKRKSEFSSGEAMKAAATDWICAMCELANMIEDIACIRCRTMRPGASSLKKWTCSRCQESNSSTDLNCRLCNAPHIKAEKAYSKQEKTFPMQEKTFSLTELKASLNQQTFSEFLNTPSRDKEITAPTQNLNVEDDDDIICLE